MLRPVGHEMRLSTTALATQQLAEFLAAVSSAPDPQSAVRMTTEHAARALEAEAAVVLRHDGGDLSNVDIVDIVGFRVGSVSAQDLLAVAMGQCCTLVVPGAGACSTAVVRLSGAIRGHLMVARSGDDGFGVDELSLLGGMARVLELTTETLNVFEAQRREVAEKEQLLASLQQRQRLLEQLSQVQRAVTRGAPLQETLDAITAGAEALFGDEVACLRLFDPDDPRMMLLVSCTGIASELIRQMWRVPAEEAGVTGQAALADSLVTLPRSTELAAAGVRAAMAAPVHDKSTVVGALAVASYRPDRVYSERDQQLLQVFAEQVSLAITDAKTHEEMQRAFHDSLTGLASRALFIDRLEHALAAAGRSGASLAALFIDLDRFKMINDSLGHTAGDAVLVSVAERLKSCLSADDTAARLGGDEFAVLLHGAGRARAVATAERIINALRKPYLVEERQVYVNASIGIAFNTASVTDGQMLLRNADIAMYQAKKNGKGRHEIFMASMSTMPIRRLDLESDLHRALSGNEFVLNYQPIVELPGPPPAEEHLGKELCRPVVAVEALLRWHDPKQGLIRPQRFIPLAEETGLIVPIGRWVIDEACRQASRWNERRPGRPPLTVSINLSTRQLQQPDLPDVIAAGLARNRLHPSHLMLEITESVLLGDTETTLQGLRRLKDLGVRLAIDDFGTGYSSLTYLRSLPIDTVKIDKSFLDGIATAKGWALVRAIVQFGQALELTTIAEGIETPGQLEQLHRAGCHLGQGYLFAKPQEPSEVETALGIE